MSLPVGEPAIENRFCMINIRVGACGVKRVRRRITINSEEIRYV
ncbi:hypothetical protein EcWSU1_01110 [Enterobacter ludwigii]|uniref:Uncharacterized protein n=1 Tax=Enterobacter ludwigii TaxID=299767 RepID=G8LDG2_9ENTR|nr:hypothetical protein EcWSU1_01110 [Enterobacter ludwigii]